MKILIIDDDKSTCWLITAELKKHGYETLEAETGKEGLQLARNEHPDLIICDYMMEKTDGYEILLALRAEPATAKIPFVLMTGSPERAGITPGSGRSPEEVLIKPIQTSELMRLVESRLPKPAAVPSSAAIPANVAASLHQLEDSLVKLDDSLKKLRALLKSS